MKKSNKRGFTIVELVIVIAVIAILAAVLIPTFSSIIKKANQSKDTQLVRNLNASLKLDVGVKHNTMQDALDAVAQQGYDLDKINASAMQAEILWDSHNDAFVYLDSEGKINYLPEIEKDREATSLELWQICNEMPATQKYSIYAGNGWNTDNIDNLSVGFDAGKNTNITSVNYVREASASEQSVVIRTNGGKLVVDAPSDTVTHYGIANVIDVNNVSPTTYKENGTVSELNIKTNNHIEIQSDATVYKMTIAETVTTPNISVSDNAILGVLFNEGGSVSDLPQSVKVINKTAIETTSNDTSIAFVKDAGEFKAAIEDATKETIKLTDDIVIPASDVTFEQTGIYTLRNGLTIDGQGFEIKCADEFPAFKVQSGWGGESGKTQGYVSTGSSHEKPFNIFYVDQGSTVTIKNLFIDGNDKPKHGINCFGNMNIEDVVIHGFRGSAINVNGDTGSAANLTFNATRLSTYDCVWSTMCFDKGAAGTTFDINLKDCTIINEHTKAAKYGKDGYEYALKFDENGNYVATVIVDGGYIESILPNNSMAAGNERSTNISYK